MNKKKFVPLAALALLLAGGTIIGVSRTAVPVHAQTLTAQNQVTQTTPDKETQDGTINTADKAQETKEGVEAAEPANEQAQEKNLPGGGHQDTNGTADHQFEGVE